MQSTGLRHSTYGIVTRTPHGSGVGASAAEGFVVRLNLSVRHPGTGQLVSAPTNPVIVGDTFPAMLKRSGDFLDSRCLERTDDIVWHLERFPSGLLEEVEGPSLGGAFALGIAQVLACMSEEVDAAARLELGNVAVVAQVIRTPETPFSLAAIGNAAAKLRELIDSAPISGLTTVVLAAGQSVPADFSPPDSAQAWFIEREIPNGGTRYRILVIRAHTVDEAIDALALAQTAPILEL